MQLPANWRNNRDKPQDSAKVGHQPNGGTVALHSLAVCPSHQKLGLGKYLMSRYIEKMREMQAVERISILTYENLVSYYLELGFQLLGASASNHGGVAWKDMVRISSLCGMGVLLMMSRFTLLTRRLIDATYSHESSATMRRIRPIQCDDSHASAVAGHVFDGRGPFTGIVALGS